ncbi:hypothetical protein [Paenibacillus lactis]|uniref:hypothetical protein n=1 Tax=Paenibacillus lactis TaxID=228574 RepID=UPI003D73F9C4
MVKIERTSGANYVKTVQCGDMVLIGEYPYIVSFVNGGHYLVGLSDGNRWSDVPLEPGINEYDLVLYIDDDNNSNIELLKPNSFDLTVNIK